MFHCGLLDSDKRALLIDIQVAASPASIFLIQLRKDSVGAKNLPIARMHSRVVSTTVLRVIAITRIVALTVLTSVERVEMWMIPYCTYSQPTTESETNYLTPARVGRAE